MSPLESLVARIRGEYREMPGLRLTFAQACRLWQVDPPTCEMLLEQLVRETFLRKTLDGTYIAPAGASSAGHGATSRTRSVGSFRVMPR
jgi:hypothetical protein